MTTSQIDQTAPGGTDLVTLRARVAICREDMRIARKHVDEAAARRSSPENIRAWLSADLWYRHCAEREREARVALIVTGA